MNSRELNKVTLLKLIRDNRDILFGRFSPTLTIEVKESKWREIVTEGHAMGFIPPDKDWKYVRDTTWQNYRKRTMEKQEKRDSNNLDMSRHKPFDESDKLVLEIVTKDPLASEKQDTFENSSPSQLFEEISFMSSHKIQTPEALVSSTHERICSNKGEKSRVAKSLAFKEQKNRLKRIKNWNQNLISLRKRNLAKESELLDYQIEISRKNSYLKDLEILREERSLQLPYSEFTIKFSEFQGQSLRRSISVEELNVKEEY